MNGVARWIRYVVVALLPLVALAAASAPVVDVGAVGCGNPPELTVPAAQAAERWRYTYEGAGSYEIVGWTPTEVTLFVNAPGCALSRMAVVELNLLSGTEMWRITTDQLQGAPEYGMTIGSGLVIISTPKAVYAFDETTGQQMWVASHAFERAPQILANKNHVIVLSYENDLIGLIERSGILLWHTVLPAGSIADWSSTDDGDMLVGLGRPDTAGQDVQAFGVDKTTGSLRWQTSVGQTVSSTGGMLHLASNRSGLVTAQVQTDGTTALSALDSASGEIRWTTPLASDTVFGRAFVTGGQQPMVIFATGSTNDVKSATGYDALTGEQRWQNQNIGADALLVDDTHLAGAGPTLSYMNALVSVDTQTGEMVWSQPFALVDGSFGGTAQVISNQLIFTPATGETPASTVMGVDLANGNVVWSNTFPEFDGVSLEGLPAGLVVVTGETATEAVLVALAP